MPFSCKVFRLSDQSQRNGDQPVDPPRPLKVLNQSTGRPHVWVKDKIRSLPCSNDSWQEQQMSNAAKARSNYLIS